ncbi:hypothetical protein DL93DRAFT_631071 [Clavulina sp. PMI_390]|nr:hypothetical protein DL93DRAFT_631071 [Clavulina sp. PMI_390]
MASVNWQLEDRVRREGYQEGYKVRQRDGPYYRGERDGGAGDSSYDNDHERGRDRSRDRDGGERDRDSRRRDSAWSNTSSKRSPERSWDRSPDRGYGHRSPTGPSRNARRASPNPSNDSSNSGRERKRTKPAATIEASPLQQSTGWGPASPVASSSNLPGPSGGASGVSNADRNVEASVWRAITPPNLAKTSNMGGWGAVDDSWGSTTATGWGDVSTVPATTGWGGASPQATTSSPATGWGAPPEAPKISSWGEPQVGKSSSAEPQEPISVGKDSGSASPRRDRKDIKGKGKAAQQFSSGFDPTPFDKMSSQGSLMSIASPETLDKPMDDNDHSKSDPMDVDPDTVDDLYAPARPPKPSAIPPPPPSALLPAEASPTISASSIDRSRPKTRPRAVSGSSEDPDRSLFHQRLSKLTNLIQTQGRSLDIQQTLNRAYKESNPALSGDVAKLEKELVGNAKAIDTLLEALIANKTGSEGEGDWPFRDTKNVTQPDGSLRLGIMTPSPAGLKELLGEASSNVRLMNDRLPKIISTEQAKVILAAPPPAPLTLPASGRASPVSKKRKVSGSAKKSSAKGKQKDEEPSQHHSDSDNPDSPPQERLQRFHTSVISIEARVREIENGIPQWSASSLNALDARLATVSEKRREEAKIVKEEEERQVEMVKAMEAVVLDERRAGETMYGITSREEVEKQSNESMVEWEGLKGRMDATSDKADDLLHAFRALAQQRDAARSLPPQIHSVEQGPLFTRQAVDALREQIAQETRNEYSQRLADRNNLFVEETRQTNSTQAAQILAALKDDVDYLRDVLGYVTEFENGESVASDGVGGDEQMMADAAYHVVGGEHHATSAVA